MRVVAVIALCAAPTVHGSEFCIREPDLYCSLFTQLTSSGILLVGRWNPAPGKREVIVGIFAQLDSDEPVITVLQPEGASFRQQLEYFTPELRKELESKYPDPRRVRIHGPLESHFRYSASAVDEKSCPAITQLYEKLQSAPLIPAPGKEWWLVEWWRGQFSFVEAPTSGQVLLRVPPQHPFAESLEPILMDLEQCVG